MRANLMIVSIFLAVLTTIVHGDSISKGTRTVREVARKGLKINNIFRPIGYLGKGLFSFVFSGTMLHPNPRQVAMKFTPAENADIAAREYEMYTYLHAINNEVVESFGIPAVYYYGRWEDYVLMAITLLDSKIHRTTEKNGKIQSFDVLVITREFVRISKYMHYCGIRHNDINADNIMFRKHQGFIIDYNLASKTYSSNDINIRRVEKSYAKEDWLCFLFSMLKFIGIEFEAADSDSESSDDVFAADILRRNITHTIERIGGIGHTGLKTVFLEFAKHVFADEIHALHLPNMSVNNNGTPFYDQVYQIIQDVMQSFRPGRPPFVSWLTDQEKLYANNYPASPISSIHDLFENATATYPAVDPDLFFRIYHC